MSRDDAAIAPALRRYVLAVSAAGSAVLVAMVATSAAAGSLPSARHTVVFLAAMVGSTIPLVTVRRRLGEEEASITDVFAFAALLLFTPAFAVIGLAVGSIVADIRRRKQLHRVIFNVAQYAISLGAAGGVVRLGGVHFDGEIGPRQIGVTALAASVFFVVNWVLVGIAVAMAQRSRLIAFLTTDLGVGTTHALATFTQGTLIALVYPHAPWALVLFLPSAHTAQIAAQRYQALRVQARQSMETLAAVLDDRDPATHEHSKRVARYAVAVAQAMGLSEPAIEEIEKAGLVHDLGKVAVADSILMKPGPLTGEETHLMHDHPARGADILGGLEIYAGVSTIVRHHHERWDGRGYPDGLAGERIPQPSRIITVVDAFDAMTTNRVYRRPVAIIDALVELQRQSGRQFDPEVVRVFSHMVGENPEAFAAHREGPPERLIAAVP